MSHQNFRRPIYLVIAALPIVGILGGFLTPDDWNPWPIVTAYVSVVAVWILGSWRFGPFGMLAGAMSLLSVATGFFGGSLIAVIMALAALALAGIAVGDIQIVSQDAV